MAQDVSFAKILEVLSSGRSAERGRDERVVLRVHVDEGCPRELALALKGALVPERPTAVVEVRPARLGPAGVAPCDAAVVLVGSRDVSGLTGAYAGAGTPVALVVEGALEAPQLNLSEQAAALVGLVAASTPEVMLDKLAAWLAGATEKDVALAADFPFCRRAVVDRLVRSCATRNAAVGAVHLIPGSDLPIMTMNQARLALDVAAAHGYGLEAASLAGVAGVVGCAFGWRAVARRLLAAAPALGGLARASVGYAGTVAAGALVGLVLDVFERGLGESVPAAQQSAPAPIAETSAGADYVVVGEGVS